MKMCQVKAFDIKSILIEKIEVTIGKKKTCSTRVFRDFDSVVSQLLCKTFKSILQSNQIASLVFLRISYCTGTYQYAVVYTVTEVSESSDRS